MDRVTFLGREAYERMRVVHEWTFDDPASSEYLFYLRVGEDWYEIAYLIAEERTTPPDSVRSYLGTFRLDGKGPEQTPGSPKAESIPTQ